MPNEIATMEQNGTLAPLAANISQTRQQQLEDLRAESQFLEVAFDLAKKACGTQLVASHFRDKPADGAIAIAFGASLGWHWTKSLQDVYVVKGKPAIMSKEMRELVIVAGHEIWEEEVGPTRVVLAGRRRGSDIVLRSEWTIDRAKKAGFTSNAQYQTNPEVMLYARSTTELARRLAPDALSGLGHSVEELRDSPMRVQSERVPSAPVTASEILGTKAAEPEAAPTDVSDLPEVDPEAAADQVAEPGVSQVEGSTVAQQRKIAILLGNEKIDDRQGKLDYLESQFGRKFTSSKELTKDEASNLIEFLGAAQAADGEQTELGAEQ